MKKTVTVMTILIFTFVLGVIVGFYTTRSRISELEAMYSELELNLRNFELQYLYTTTFNRSLSCSFLNLELTNILEDVDEFLRLLSTHQDGGSDVADIEKKYMVLVVQHWLMTERIKKDCGRDIESVLYFHTPERDPLVGHCLSEIRSSSENFLVFPLRLDLDVSIVNALKEVYNITKIPTVIINNSIRYEGLINESNFIDFCCERKNITGIC